MKKIEHGFVITKIDGEAHLKLVLQPTISNCDNFYFSIKLFKNSLVEINKIILDLSEVEKYDSFLPSLINEISKVANSKEIAFEIVNQSQKINQYLAVMQIPSNRDNGSRRSFIQHIETIGNNVKTVLSDAFSFIDFIGDVFRAFLNMLIKPNSIRWADFPSLFIAAGINALPIASLITLIIGLVTAYQGAVQLRQFGADAYLADLVGVSIVKELGPLMTAIIVAGRSGAAYAAEIGSMKASEEVDALISMGFSPISFLVAPRIIAVSLAIPLLTVLADAVGIIGGLSVGVIYLKLTAGGFFHELATAISVKAIIGSMFKAFSFGVLISSVGCFRGLQVKGGAESVGKYTTAAVVSGILLIILADALFSFLFPALGL